MRVSIVAIMLKFQTQDSNHNCIIIITIIIIINY